MNFGELIIELYRNTLYELRKLAKSNQLTISQMLCILSIPIDGISQTNLAIKLSLDISTLSRNLDRLLDKEVIIKNYKTYDKRISTIYLTPQGSKLYQRLIDTLNNNLKKQISEPNVLELQTLIDSMSDFNWLLIQKQLDEH